MKYFRTVFPCSFRSVSVLLNDPHPAQSIDLEGLKQTKPNPTYVKPETFCFYYALPRQELWTGRGRRGEASIYSLLSKVVRFQRIVPGACPQHPEGASSSVFCSGFPDRRNR